MPLTKEQIEDHHAALRMACDPRSPFFGMVDFAELLALPVPDQQAIYDAMPPDLRGHVERYMAKRASS